MGNMVSRLYRVRKGDTILAICQMYNLRWPQFVRLNPQFDEFGTRDPSVIFPGEYFVVGYMHKDILKMVKDYNPKED
jgi:hypothetical protein